MRADGEKILRLENDIVERFRQIVATKIGGMRIRCHGDLHLGQVLYTGNDFVIIDFEGEPSRPLTERRIKRSPLRDVAGMLRSFDYAAVSVTNGGDARLENLGLLKPWAGYWSRWASVHFLQGYFEVTRKSVLLPKTAPELKVMLQVYLLEKAIYELAYELNNRPDWVHVPIDGILSLIEEGA